MNLNVYLIFLIQILVICTAQSQYCVSNATNTGASKIDNVRLVGETITINQNSAGPCETYTDHTLVPPADLMIGNNYSVEISLGTCNNDRNKSANVYIDFNQDNDFDDFGEDLGNTGLTTVTATLTVNFTLNACPSPLLGTTRMRIVAVQGTGAITPCGTYARGETEDYSVRIVANPSNAFYLVGDATLNTPSCIQLTTATNSQLGMAWDINRPLNFALPFTYDFVVNLGSDNAGADGLMFIIQNDPALQCVVPSGGWGAGNISNSLSIEIDTYLNFEDRDDGLPGVLCVGGTEPDHLDIWLDGVVNPTTGTCGTGARIIPAAIPLLDGGADYNVENGLDHIFRITWLPGLPGTLTASLLDAGGLTTYAIVSHSFDPLLVFGTNTPIYGLSGSTGGLNNAQSFCEASILLNNKLTTFDAYLTPNNAAKLEWTAISETLGEQFVIEKSSKGQVFEVLTSIPAKGLKNETNTYQVVDPNPFLGYTYYRLKQVNVSGQSTYSTIRVVHKEASANFVKIYPNPTKNQLNIESLSVLSSGTVTLYNSLGQIVGEPFTFSGTKTTLDVSNLGTGVYLLQLKNETYTSQMFKVIKE